MKYIIETYFAVSDTWENTYMETENATPKPLVFDNKSDAEHELNLMFEQSGYDYEHGYIDHPMYAQDYRIRAIDDFDGIPEYIEDYFDPEIELDKMYEQYEKDNQK